MLWGDRAGAYGGLLEGAYGRGGDSGGLVAPWQVMWGRMPCAKVGLKAQESGR